MSSRLVADSVWPV